jgi:hypothetical protein
VALSTIEAKKQGITNDVKNITWLRALLKDLKIDYGDPTIILCNNQSALKLVRNLVLHAKTKHIELEHHFI